MGGCALDNGTFHIQRIWHTYRMAQRMLTRKRGQDAVKRRRDRRGERSSRRKIYNAHFLGFLACLQTYFTERYGTASNLAARFKSLLMVLFYL